MVLDLSMGGVQFSLKREEWKAMELGSQLVLARLSEGEKVLCDGALPLTVRWVLDHPMVSNVSVGCEFDELPEDGRRLLQSFLARRLPACKGDGA